MPERIADVTRYKMLTLHLAGESRDGIAQKTGAGTGTVSHVISEFKHLYADYDIDALRALGVAMKNAGVTPQDCADAVRTLNMLSKFNVSADNNLNLFVNDLYKACSETGLPAKELVEIASQMLSALSALKEEEGFVSSIEELPKHVGRLEEQRASLLREIDDLQRKRDAEQAELKEQLKSKNTTLLDLQQFVATRQTLGEQLRGGGEEKNFSIVEDLPMLANMLKNAKELDYDVSAIAAKISTVDSLRKQETVLRAAKEEKERSKKNLVQECLRLKNKIGSYGQTIKLYRELKSMGFGFKELRLLHSTLEELVAVAVNDNDDDNNGSSPTVVKRITTTRSERKKGKRITATGNGDGDYHYHYDNHNDNDDDVVEEEEEKPEDNGALLPSLGKAAVKKFFRDLEYMYPQVLKYEKKIRQLMAKAEECNSLAEDAERQYADKRALANTIRTLTSATGFSYDDIVYLECVLRKYNIGRANKEKFASDLDMYGSIEQAIAAASSGLEALKKDETLLGARKSQLQSDVSDLAAKKAAISESIRTDWRAIQAMFAETEMEAAEGISDVTQGAKQGMEEARRLFDVAKKIGQESVAMVGNLNLEVSKQFAALSMIKGFEDLADIVILINSTEKIRDEDGRLKVDPKVVDRLVLHTVGILDLIISTFDRLGPPAEARASIPTKPLADLRTTLIVYLATANNKQ